VFIDDVGERAKESLDILLREVKKAES